MDVNKTKIALCPGSEEDRESGRTMSATTPSLSLSNFRPRFQNPAKTHHLSPLSWSVSRTKISPFHRQAPRFFLLHQEKTQLWRISATPEEIVSSDSSSEAIVSSVGDQDGAALVVQVLLITAFLALSLLTIGVSFIQKPNLI